jgi:tRNA pseudouridine38-40 synthase
LETTLERITGKPVKTLAAGRTDAGVHADGQVVAFDTGWRHSLHELERATNALLPQDSAVRDLVEVAPDFHPRYDAVSRVYQYTVYNARVRSPLARRKSLHVSKPLDFGAMQAATALVVGEQDFAAFGRSTWGGTTVRRVFEARWTARLPYLNFEIEANAFLFRMVRSIVGTLLKVGQGGLLPDEIAAILASRDRGRAGQTAPPHGLCLVQVKY